MNKGEVEVAVLMKRDTKKNEKIATLTDGSIFGEVALLTKLKRTASIMSSAYTSCAYIGKAEVKVMENQFPHIV